MTKDASHANDAGRRTLADRIRAREPLTGLLVKMPAAVVIEIAAEAGFDFVVVDTEHGPNDSELLQSHLRAADGAGIPVLVRIPSSDSHNILFALDAGAAGIIVPRTVHVADVDAIVSMAFYPPHGHRGLSLSTRAGRHGLGEVNAHVEAALRETVLVVQVEDAAAVPNAASIAAHPRVDAVFIGPNDLSSSMGLPGDVDHPEVQAAVRSVVTAVDEQHPTAICMLATSAAGGVDWRQQGATMLIFTAEVLIARHLQSIAEAVKHGQVELGADGKTVTFS